MMPEQVYCDCAGGKVDREHCDGCAPAEVFDLDRNETTTGDAMMHERDDATIDVLRKALAALVGAAADQASQVSRLERSGLTIEPQLLNLLRTQSVAWAHLADAGARAIAASYPANGVVCAIPVGLSPHRVPVLGSHPADEQTEK